MSTQIQIKRGLQAMLPNNLAEGEMAFCLDTKKLYIGGTGENVLLNEDSADLSYVYECTGQDDNVTICQIVTSFLNTDDGFKSLKIYIRGVAGVDITAFGNGTSSNPYKVFFENGSNPYGKTVTLNGVDCTFPKVEYSEPGVTHVRYFNMKNVRLENISLEITNTAALDTHAYVYSFGFYDCSDLYNCVSLSTVKPGPFAVSGGYGYAFSRCKNLFNCKGVGQGDGNALTNGLGRGYGFDNCINLHNCEGTGDAKASGNTSDQGTAEGVGFNSCTDLFNCVGNGVGDSTGHGTAWGYGFSGCVSLSNCTGTGTGKPSSGQGNSGGCGFSFCERLSNCNASGICKGGSAGTNNAYGFSNCTNLANCTGMGDGSNNAGVYGYGFTACVNLSNCIGTGDADGPAGVFGYGFNNCNNLSSCTGTGSVTGAEGGQGFGFSGCKRLISCKGYGYRLETMTGESSGFNWSSSTTNVAQMVNCTAPIKNKTGYVQRYGIRLDGTTDGAKYCLVGTSIAEDVQGGFIGIKKHSKTGDDYTEIGTIRANVE